MNDRQPELQPEIESRWREWAETEPVVDERQLRRNLLQRIPDRRRRATGRLVLVAAAASLVAVLIGIETTRQPPPTVVADETVVHETGPNVILVLREGGEPIYLATDVGIDQSGE
jgi:ferric-dicitrate binding protein FerR (iron transport regulator)